MELMRLDENDRFLSYELIQRAFKRYSPDMNPGTANFLSGGLASNAFWISSFPFDAVKKYVTRKREDLRRFAELFC